MLRWSWLLPRGGGDRDAPALSVLECRGQGLAALAPTDAVLAAAATVAWAPRVPDVEPTTIVWFERAEIAATIAVIPLAVHLTGLFDMIRGL